MTTTSNANDPGTIPNPGAAEERVFGTEVQQLLHLMIHSLYSKKEIFLRELISNSSDAIDTLRFLSLTRPELRSAQDSQEPAIEITVDKEQKTIRITDTGIGMTRQQVIDNIGTIARSGTGTLVKKLKELKAQKDDKGGDDKSQSLDVIGQFGVGFYSAFMVAQRVELETLSAEPDAQSVAWSCEGGGSYKLAVGTRTSVGTTVTLHVILPQVLVMVLPALVNVFIAFFKAHGTNAVIMLLAISLFQLPNFVSGPMYNPMYVDMGLTKDTVGAVRGMLAALAAACDGDSGFAVRGSDGARDRECDR